MSSVQVDEGLQSSSEMGVQAVYEDSEKVASVDDHLPQGTAVEVLLSWLLILTSVSVDRTVSRG